jgi:hypothetical protein
MFKEIKIKNAPSHSSLEVGKFVLVSVGEFVFDELR